MVYTSGVIPVIPETGEIAEGGVEAQAEQAFKNLCNLVEASGAKVENIVVVAHGFHSLFALALQCKLNKTVH